MDLDKSIRLAQDHFKENKKLIQNLKKKKPKDLDQVTSELHDEVFTRIDCLDCANCCKSISPIITDKDIQRIARHLKMKPSAFVDTYLNLDHEHDYVFRSQPCPFLGPDHYCNLYSVRPKACAEYPHTDRKKFVQLLNLSLKNTSICPAVTEVFIGLKKHYL